MKFGIFYEHQLPRPWTADSEHRLLQESLTQIELADRLGYDYAWEVEHHFLEEYSHSSAPEVFLGAASQRTKRIRLGHGIIQLPTNHPIWVACSNISTIGSAGQWGMGALGFQFVTPEAARAWVTEYYINLTQRPAKLADYPANPNVAMVSAFMCAPTDEEAQAKAAGWTFFVFCLSHYGRHGMASPGQGNMWELYQEWRHTPKARETLKVGLIGSPETIRRKLREFEATNVDQVILLNQTGRTSHEDICSSLELFAREVMPEFQALEPEHQRWKDDVLAGRVTLEDLDTDGFKVYAHQNEDIVRLTPEQLKQKMAAKEAGNPS